jgi:hypothetical protein
MASTALIICLSRRLGAIRLPSFRSLASPGVISNLSFLSAVIACFARVSTLMGLTPPMSSGEKSPWKSAVSINEASPRTPPISVRGDLEKRAFVRACCETQLSSRWQRLWVHRFNLSQVRELIAIQCAVASTIISDMDGDFYTTLRWRLLRGFMARRPLEIVGDRPMTLAAELRAEQAGDDWRDPAQL